jgi:hypothetical protein
LGRFELRNYAAWRELRDKSTTFAADLAAAVKYAAHIWRMPFCRGPVGMTLPRQCVIRRIIYCMAFWSGAVEML